MTDVKFYTQKLQADCMEVHVGGGCCNESKIMYMCPDGGGIDGGTVSDGGPIADGGTIADGGARPPDGGGLNDGGLIAEDGGPVEDGGLVADGGSIEDGGPTNDGGSINDGGLIKDGGAIADGGATQDAGTGFVYNPSQKYLALCGYVNSARIFPVHLIWRADLEKQLVTQSPPPDGGQPSFIYASTRAYSIQLDGGDLPYIDGGFIWDYCVKLCFMPCDQDGGYDPNCGIPGFVPCKNNEPLPVEGNGKLIFSGQFETGYNMWDIALDGMNGGVVSTLIAKFPLDADGGLLDGGTAAIGLTTEANDTSSDGGVCRDVFNKYICGF